MRVQAEETIFWMILSPSHTVGSVMKRHMPSVARLVLAAILTSGTATAQLSGTYTVGGDSPDFETPQAAADSLVSLGISGPVEVLIRPGVYEAGANGDVPALSIGETINGLDAVNRVSFRADVAAGGDTSNVILTRRVGSPVISISPASLQSTVSHITLEGFAVAVEDTAANVSALDPAIVLKGRVVDPMREVRIIGLKINGGGRRAGVAISIQECGIDFTVERNVITDAARAADIDCVDGSGFRFVDNLVHKTGYRRRGANPAIPTIVGLDLANGDAPIIEGNVIDMTGQCGSYILRVLGGDRDAQMRNARVVGNRIINYACGGGDWGTTGGAINVGRTKGYTLVANNMVSVGTTASLSGFGGNAMVLAQDFDSMLVAHNTVYAWQNTVGPRIIAPEADGAHAVIVNNILVNENKPALAIPSGSVMRDYNVLSNGSDIGPNSIIKTPEFVDTRSDLHLEECAFEDASLTGMPRPEVTFDFDVEARDPVAPFVGADEPAGSPPEVFGGPTVFTSGMESFLMASGDLDDDGDIDLAVTNVEAGNGGNDVTILWNDGNGTFSDPQHLPFGTDPTQIEIGYVNGGDILDLVVLAGDGIH
ncbi:MAG: hypothetical protein KJO98_13385, partial [Rhodothermia bacterium]|nr:hypothetical protein [Rhodothermia bacterium]